MKKTYTLIAMMLMLFTGTALAQHGWDYEPTVVDEIIPGEDHFYVINQGFGPKNAGGADGFLNTESDKLLPLVNHSCVFNFIEVDKKEASGETFKIFILKNIATGKYLTDNGERYTASPIEAFKFTARKAVHKVMTDEIKQNWYEFSNAINKDKCPDSEGVNWVFCHPTDFKFIAFAAPNGATNPGWSTGYIVSTNWRVYSAKEKELSAKDKFFVTYDQYYGTTTFDQGNYPVGNLPGCISQEMYNEMNAVFTEANAATAATNLTDAEYNSLNQKIQDVFAKYKTAIIPFAPGYYGINNESTGFLTEGNVLKCDGEMTSLPTEWTLENAKYIWKVEEAPNTKGYYYIQNVMSERYVGDKSNLFAMVEKPKKPLFVMNYRGFWFNMKESNGFMHTKKDGTVNVYGNTTDPNNHWKFLPIKETAIDSLRSEITQNNLNKNMSKRVAHIESNFKALQVKNGMTEDGIYASNAKGLVTAFEKTNADDTHEGGDPQFAFDGNINTYYHTIWSNEAPSGVRHWVQVDFGELMQDVYLKMTRRTDNLGAIPTRIGIYASEGDDLEAADWVEELYEDTVIYTYQNLVGDSLIDSATYIKKIHFARPVQHVRFTATHTIANKYWNEGGPTWCVAEMRFYKPEDCVHNPSYDLIPQEVITTLNDAIAIAKAEIAAGKATQETLDALNEAYDALWEAYPDPSKLNSLMEAALFRYEVAVESADNADTDWGYYKTGAKAEYKKALDAIAEKVNNSDKVLTLEDINNLETALRNEFNKFNAQLIVPANGIYHILCAPGYNEENGNPIAGEGAFVASANCDNETSAAWGYKDDSEIESRWNTLWYIEKDAEGKFSFKNLATGLYLDNPYEGLTEEQQDSITTSTHIAFSKSPKHYNLQASPEAGKFVFNLKYKRYMNASSQKKVENVGSPMAIWSNYNEKKSKYTFEAVTVEDFYETYRIDCAKNAIQIVSLPLEVKGAGTTKSSAYKVLGVKDSLIWLKLYELDEIIPAGTPFIVATGENETSYEVTPNVTTYEDLLKTTYNLDPVVQNGLVSAPKTFKAEAGYGMIFQDKVIPTIGGEDIIAGTGFFNKNIPATAVEGDFSLELKGLITGEGTAIEDIAIANNKSNDVYTITGIKVRQNVKGAESTQDLPKGIYIIGGKKVLVK